MSIDFFQRLKSLKGTYIQQMLFTREDFPAKISLNKHFSPNSKGVTKITLLLKDPVQGGNVPHVPQ